MSDLKLHDSLLEIRQIAQIVDPQGLQSYEVRYYLSPYVPNEGFIPKETSNFEWVGFFETSPTFVEKSGYTKTYINKWDLRKPIVFSISANTPKRLVRSIKEGVLYWNKAFAAEVLQVRMAPEGVTAPDPRYNIIQWVPNDAAGSAYADMLTDPRTGEILHAQVYLPSVFDTLTKARLRNRMRSIASVSSSKPPALHHLFEADNICDFPVMDNMLGKLEEYLETAGNAITDDALERITYLYIKCVVAHEVGHTLGLRHNFAGSLGATISPDSITNYFNNYLVANSLPPQDVLFSSSIMEYSNFYEEVLLTAGKMSDREILPFDLLPYDKEAILWGYKGVEPNPASASLFCTDSQVEKYADCRRFDSGPDPVITNFENLRTKITQLPMAIINDFIFAKSSFDPAQRKNYQSVALNLDATVAETIGLVKEQLAWYSASGRPSLKIDRQFGFRNSFNDDDALKSGTHLGCFPDQDARRQHIEDPVSLSGRSGPRYWTVGQAHRPDELTSG